MTALNLYNGILASACLVSSCGPQDGFQAAVAMEGRHLSWINKVASVRKFEADNEVYSIAYLPVGVPYYQARDADGYIIPDAEPEWLIIDSGTRTLEVSRAGKNPFQPRDEKEAKKVAEAFCARNNGWPKVAKRIEEITPNEKEFIEGEKVYPPDTDLPISFSYDLITSFSDGVFRFPEICYAD